MADLKTPYDNPAMPAPDLSGQGVTSRGNDPLIDLAGSSGLQAVAWSDQPASFPDNESSNSVSGLPSRPARWEPSASSEEPPDLTDRTPGTIDRQ